MLTDREIATAIIILGVAVWAATVPGVRQSFADVIRALFHWRVIVLFVLYFAYAALLIVGAWRVGLWHTGMVKDTVLVVVVTGIPMLMHSNEVKDGTDYLRKVARETVGVSAFVAFYVNLATFGVVAELVLQVLATVVAMMLVFVVHHEEHSSLRKPLRAMLIALGLIVLAKTTHHLLTAGHAEDWPTVLRTLGMSVWFPLLLAPLIYVLAFAMTCGSISSVLQIFNGRQRPPFRVRLAMVLGFRFRASLASGFKYRWRPALAKLRTFREARQLLAEYRANPGQDAR